MEKLIGTLNILGIQYCIYEADCVNKTIPRRGEIDYEKATICIDRKMPASMKEQVLLHEVLHAIFDALGMEDVGGDERAVQSLATALHCVVGTKITFSSLTGSETEHSRQRF